MSLGSAFGVGKYTPWELYSQYVEEVVDVRKLTRRQMAKLCYVLLKQFGIPIQSTKRWARELDAEIERHIFEERLNQWAENYLKCRV